MVERADDAARAKTAPDLTTAPVAGTPTRPTAAAGPARVFAVVILTASVGVLAAAAWVRPDVRGFGTHMQFSTRTGPCGFLDVTGYPCPSCGMTTSFAHFVRGQWLRALWVQPSGFLLALLTAGASLVSAYALVVGRWPGGFSLRRLSPAALLGLMLVLLLAGWAWRLGVGVLDGSLPVPRPIAAAPRLPP